MMFNSLSSWITIMRLRQFSYKTIKSYMTGVQSYYVELGASKEKLDIFHTPILKHIIAYII